MVNVILKYLPTLFLSNNRATVNGGNGNGKMEMETEMEKGSSKLPAVQLKMEEIYGWYGP